MLQLFGAMYVASFMGILAFSLMELQLVVVGWIRKNNTQLPALLADTVSNNLPNVTIQLPIFNEQYVAARIIDAVVALQYPRQCLQIQVLDDSTDQTLLISQQKIAHYQALGYNISLLHRHHRTAYKAGALQAALPLATGSFVALFDADFVPSPNFLLHTLPYFDQAKVGAVQTRWGHLNRNYSLLTRIQAFFIDTHFAVEQSGRTAGNFCLNFNGTAGIWRKTTITDAGGWQADTLTEDLDLSYRAQLKGWTIAFVEHIICPAELPADMRAFKLQQHRWIKGGVETLKKMLPQIWQGKLSIAQKINATAHLLSSSIYIAILLNAIVSGVLLFAHAAALPPYVAQYVYLYTLSNVALLSIGFTTWYKSRQVGQFFWADWVWLFPFCLAISFGMSAHNTWAAWQGYRGQKSAFERTPKFNLIQTADNWQQKRYTHYRLGIMWWIELALLGYFVTTLAYAWHTKQYVFVIQHALATLGFGMMVYYGWLHYWQTRQK